MFEWTKETEDAAQLIADGRLTENAVAEKLGVTRRTLYTWKQNPEFAARIKEILDRYREETEGLAIAQKVHRVRRLNKSWGDMQEVVAARASDPSHAIAPGGDTGLLVRQEKIIGKGDAAEKVTEFAVDTGLLRELREHEKQAAQELGQWVDKNETDVKSDGRRVPIQIVKVMQPAPRPPSS